MPPEPPLASVGDCMERIDAALVALVQAIAQLLRLLPGESASPEGRP